MLPPLDVRLMQIHVVGAHNAKLQFAPCKAHALSGDFNLHQNRIAVQHAYSACMRDGQNLSGPDEALLIVDMINRFDSTAAMQCKAAHALKIAATIHWPQDGFDAGRRPGIHNNDHAGAGLPPAYRRLGKASPQRIRT